MTDFLFNVIVHLNTLITFYILVANSLALAFSNLVILAEDLFPRDDPPQCFLISSARSLKLVLTVSTSLFKDPRSAESTSVIAKQVVVFLRTTRPMRALFFTMQYGTPIFRQRAGRNKTSSIGSTSLAMTTSFAFFFSTSVVTVFTPCRTTGPRLVGVSSLPSARASARALRRSFLSCFVSGRYLSNNLNNCVAVCLSRAWLNWLIGGGTFNLVWRTAFCL